MIWTLVVYLAAHQVEGNVLYPLIQRRAVDLPPALTILAVLALGILLGGLGVVLAAPLLVVAHTSVKRLQVSRYPGEETAAPGQGHGGAARPR